MKKVGILGATGVIGKQYLSLLRNHPWFKVHALAASDKSAGSLFEGFTLKHPNDLLDCDLIFSALPAHFAHEYEPLYAKEGAIVFSSSSCFRNDEDIPLLIPEINKNHLDILPIQKKKRSWKGVLLSKPNCSIQSFLIPLAPLHRDFQIEEISVTTLQAISGAGNQGLSSYAILDNVIPYIENEEEKTEKEPLKILGMIKNDAIVSENTISISAQCNRVPVLHGHLACVSVSFRYKPTRKDILDIWNQSSSLTLPLAPKFPVYYVEDLDRPQPRLDREKENGMAVSVGRLRPCPLFDWRFVALSHNAARGGAGGGVLSAELLVQEGFFG